MYTAPPAVPNPASVTVTATSTVDATVTGSAILTIKSAAPMITTVTPSSFPLGSFALSVVQQLPAGVVAWLEQHRSRQPMLEPHSQSRRHGFLHGNNLLRVAIQAR